MRQIRLLNCGCRLSNRCGVVLGWGKRSLVLVDGEAVSHGSVALPANWAQIGNAGRAAARLGDVVTGLKVERRDARCAPRHVAFGVELRSHMRQPHLPTKGLRDPLFLTAAAMFDGQVFFFGGVPSPGGAWCL